MMRLDFWIAALFRLSRSQHHPVVRRRREAYRRRLHVEPLEDRRVLATIIVDSLADNTTSDGSITLREAIIAANSDTVADAMEGIQAGSGDDTIMFDASLFSSGPATIVLTQGSALSIGSNVTIIGPGTALLTIDATGNDPTPNSQAADVDFTDDGDGTSVFSIGGGTVSISGLSLTGGDAQSGGAIVSQGSTLTIDDVHMHGNNALVGGAMAIFGAGPTGVTVSNSIIGHQNSALGNQARDEGGGAFVELSNNEIVTLDGLLVLNNRALNGSGGGILVENGFGSPDAGDFTLQDSIVSGNWAGGIVFTLPTNSFGGGIFVRSLHVGLFEDGSTRFVRSSISNNTAIGQGGGIFFDLLDESDGDPNNPKMMIEIEDTTINNNLAYSQASFGSLSAASGGGGVRMAVSGDFQTTITNSTISGNRAMNGGGLLLTGHGITGPSSPIEVRHSTITGNIAGPFDPMEYAPYVGGDGYATTVGGGIAIITFEGTPPELFLDHTIVGGNLHQQNEGVDPGPPPHSDESINFSPDIGLDPPPSDVTSHPNHPPLEPGDPSYHLYTVDVNYALIGIPGGHVSQNVLELDGSFLTGSAGLGPLEDNGGFELPDGTRILTHEPNAGSQVIDAGNPGASPGSGTVPLFDQRGNPFTRVYDGDGDMAPVIDIGAVEFQPQPEEPCPPGDYNDDESVDAADYVVWRKFLGTSYDLPNEDTAVSPGTVTEGDYDVWVQHFGEVCEEESRTVAAVEMSEPARTVGNVKWARDPERPVLSRGLAGKSLQPQAVFASERDRYRDVALLLLTTSVEERLETDIIGPLTENTESGDFGSAKESTSDSFFGSYGVWPSLREP